MRQEKMYVLFPVFWGCGCGACNKMYDLLPVILGVSLGQRTPYVRTASHDIPSQAPAVCSLGIGATPTMSLLRLRVCIAIIVTHVATVSHRA